METWFIALLAGALILLAALFAPKYGIAARIRTNARLAARILIEDALKHIYDCEYKQRECTIASISGAVHAPQNKTAELLQRMQDGKLISTSGDAVRLSANGREYALRIIRSHRLWERFLADETMIHETGWHSAAERKEHTLSEDEVNQLAAKLGHPHFDPHGDPIPTELGNQPAIRGFTLKDIGQGGHARIVHIEDEPESTYAGLVQAGFKPGQILTMLQSTPEGFLVGLEDSSIPLSHLQAGNLTIVPAEGDDAPESEPAATLADVPLGSSAVVKRILPGCRGQQRRRLMDLGVLPGTRISAEAKAPFGEPVAYRIRGASIALRRDQARMIEIEVPQKTKVQA